MKKPGSQFLRAGRHQCGISSTCLTYLVNDTRHALDETANLVLIRLVATKQLGHCGASRVVKLGNRQAIEVFIDGCREITGLNKFLALKPRNASQHAVPGTPSCPASANLTALRAVLFTATPQAGAARLVLVVAAILPNNFRHGKLLSGLVDTNRKDGGTVIPEPRHPPAQPMILAT